MWVIEKELIGETCWYRVGWCDRSNRFHTLETTQDYDQAVKLCSKLNGGK